MPRMRLAFRTRYWDRHRVPDASDEPHRRTWECADRAATRAPCSRADRQSESTQEQWTKRERHHDADECRAAVGGVADALVTLYDMARSSPNA